jgi:acetyl-CoA carboxylase biotin carboxyl carrier protein
MSPMDLRKIKKLIDLVEESGISELEVHNGEESIRIVRGSREAAAAGQGARRANDSAVSRPSPSARGFLIRAPLTGTFYVAPAPGEAPFVSRGQQVAIGDVLCIIESMKMMNQIEAERAGRIVEVLVDDGVPVETGTPLFRVE